MTDEVILWEDDTALITLHRVKIYNYDEYKNYILHIIYSYEIIGIIFSDGNFIALK